MDELIELVVDVLKIADEVLMDRLKEICENVLGDQGSSFDLFLFFPMLTLLPPSSLAPWLQQMVLTTNFCAYATHSTVVRAKTAVSFLEISLMHTAESLTTTCIDFLCNNIEMALDQG